MPALSNQVRLVGRELPALGDVGRHAREVRGDPQQRLAAEEQKHIEFIEAAIRTLDEGSEAPPSGPDLEQADRFGQRAESEMLDQTVIESMIPDVAILRMAYLIERDFAEFYETAAAKAEGKAKTTLSALAKWERGHERLFKNLHDRVFEEYAEMPWGG